MIRDRNFYWKIGSRWVGLGTQFWERNEIWFFAHCTLLIRSTPLLFFLNYSILASNCMIWYFDAVLWCDCWKFLRKVYTQRNLPIHSWIKLCDRISVWQRARWIRKESSSYIFNTASIDCWLSTVLISVYLQVGNETYLFDKRIL